MEQRAERKITAASWKSVLVPYAEEYIRDITTTKEQFIVRQCTSEIAEVEGIKSTFEVDLQNKQCGCIEWQLTGLSCIHAVAFIATKGVPLWHIYVDESYYVFRYQMAYEGHISTLPSKDQWSLIENIFLTVPKSLRPRGRPKKKRVKNFLENAKSVHQCSRCGLWGHHKTSCKNPLTGDNYTQAKITNREKLPIRRTEDELN